MSLLAEAGAGINSGPGHASVSSCTLPSTPSYADPNSHNHSHSDSYIKMNLKLNFTPINLKRKKRARSTSSSSDNTYEYMLGTADIQKEQEKGNGCESSELSRFKHRKGCGNGNLMENEGTKLKLGELGLLPTAESIRKKLLKTRLGWKEKLNENVITRIEFYHGDNLSKSKLEEVTQLTKVNMESLYNENGPHWSWDDKKKNWELTQPEVRLILVYGDRDNTFSNKQELETTASIGEECKNVLIGLIDKIPTLQVKDLIDEMIEKVMEKDDSLSMQSSAYAPQGESDGTCLIGVAVFSFLCTYNIPHLYVQELQIRESHRGNGVGSIMMEHIHEIAKATRQKMLLLTAFRNNPKAVKFYKKLGYNVDEASPGPCFNVTKSPHELLSMTLDDSLKQHKCIEEGCGAHFRFKESLTRHQCIEHKKDWPYVCTADGCGLGVITKEQRRKHMKLQHGVIFRKPKVKKEPNPAYSNRRKRQPRDSDYMFALMLQKQEARRSSRKRTASCKMEDYEYYSPIKSNQREVRDKKASGPAPPEKKKLESLVKEDVKGETRTVSSKRQSEPKKLHQKIGLAEKKENDDDAIDVGTKETNLGEKTEVIRGTDKRQVHVVKKTGDRNRTGIDNKQQIEVDKNNPEFQKAVKIAYAMVNCICKDKAYNETVSATAIAKAITAETDLSAEVIRLAIVHAALKAKKEVASTNHSERANIHFDKKLGAKFSMNEVGEISGIQSINIKNGSNDEKNKIGISNAIGRKTEMTVITAPNVTKAVTETSNKTNGDSKNTKENTSSGSTKKKNTKKKENGSAKKSKDKGNGTTDNFGEGGGYNSDETDRSDADKGKKKDDDHSTDTYDNSSEDEDIPLSKLVKKKKAAVSTYVKKNAQKTQQLRERLQRIYEDSLPGKGEFKTKLKKGARKRKKGLGVQVDNGKSAKKSDEESTQEDEMVGQREDEETTDNERVDDSKGDIIKSNPSKTYNKVVKTTQVKVIKKKESKQRKSDTILNIPPTKKHRQSSSQVENIQKKNEKLPLPRPSPPPAKKVEKKSENIPLPPPYLSPTKKTQKKNEHLPLPPPSLPPAKKAQKKNENIPLPPLSLPPEKKAQKKSENLPLPPPSLPPATQKKREQLTVPPPPASPQSAPKDSVTKPKPKHDIQTVVSAPKEPEDALNDSQSAVPDETVPKVPKNTGKKPKHGIGPVVPASVPNEPDITIKKRKHDFQPVVSVSKPKEAKEALKKPKHHHTQSVVSVSKPKEPNISVKNPNPDIPPPPPPPRQRQQDKQMTETLKKDTMKPKLKKDKDSKPCQSLSKKEDSDIPPPPPPPPPPAPTRQSVLKKETEKAKRNLDVHTSPKRSKKAKKKPKYIDSPGISSDNSEDNEGENDEDYTEVDDGDVDQDYLLALKLQRELNARGRRRTGRN